MFIIHKSWLHLHKHNHIIDSLNGLLLSVNEKSNKKNLPIKETSMSFIEYVLKYFGYVRVGNALSAISNNVQYVEKDKRHLPTQASPNKLALIYDKGSALIDFEKVGNALVPDGYCCVPMTAQSRQDLYNALSFGAGVVSFGTSVAPLTGLYKATAPIKELMKLSTGGYSSSLIGANGKIVAQKGFVQAGASAFTPMIVFQLMSFVTSQYYLNGINKQLRAMDDKLDFIIKELEAEKQGKINSAVVTFRIMAEQKAYSLDDLVVARMKMSELLDLYCFYVFRMEEMFHHIISKKNNIDNTFNRKDVKEMKTILEDSKFFEYNCRAKYCYQIYCFGQLLYLKMLAFSMNNDPISITKFEEIVSSFKGNDKGVLENTFETHKCLFEKLCSDVSDYIEYKGNDAIFFRGSLKKYGASINHEFEKEKLLFENEAINEIKMMQSKIIDYFESPVEMLCQCSENGEAYVFCLEQE